MFLNPVKYEQPVFRPPSEAESFLVQITIGCSHNSCSFCGMYKTKKFRVKSFEEIENDIKKAKTFFQNTGRFPRRIFLCDGDALAMETKQLVQVLKLINVELKNPNRIGIYASARNVLEKSDDELKELADNNLGIAYLGMESGSDAVLDYIGKGNSNQQFIESCLRLKNNGLKISVIAMLGIGGTKFCQEHCMETAKTVSKVVPNFFSFLSTTPVPGTALYKWIEKETFIPLSTYELLEEMRSILQEINIVSKERIIFRANHVSNMFPLSGVIPRDQEKLLAILNEWIKKCPRGVYPDIDPSML